MNTAATQSAAGPAGGLRRLEYDPTLRGPLADVRVLDLSRLVAGNVVSHLLADFGADVVKVEPPGRGDDLRAWRVDGVSTYWKVYGRNKRSVALDFRAGRGRELLLELIAGAQMLVENFVPGKLEKLGLAPERLLAINPRLVIVRVSGWGQTGPFARKPGFGTLVEAMSGFAAMNGFADREPVLPPLALADMVSGLYGATAAMIALREVERRDSAGQDGGRGGGQGADQGAGQVIDLSLFEPMHAILGPEAVNVRLTGQPPARNGSRAPNTAPRNVYRCSDGKYVALSAAMQSVAERLFRVMGREDLIDDPRFATNSDRLANGDAIDAIVAEFIGRRSRAENLALFEAAAVTVGPVADAADLMQDGYVRERECLVELPDGEIGQLPMHNIVPRLSATPGAFRRPAPAVGEHGREILAEIGVDEDELAALVREGIVSLPDPAGACPRASADTGRPPDDHPRSTRAAEAAGDA
ncbi:MAG: CaiB/BaiF CoA transferase family protein [Lautropia sp.]